MTILLLSLLMTSCQSMFERMECPRGEPKSTDFSDHFPSFCIKTYPGTKRAFDDIPGKIELMNQAGPLGYIMGLSFWLVDTPVSTTFDTLLYPLDALYSDPDSSWNDKAHRRLKCYHKTSREYCFGLISQWRESQDQIEIRYRDKFTEEWRYRRIDKNSLCCENKEY